MFDKTTFFLPGMTEYMRREADKMMAVGAPSDLVTGGLSLGLRLGPIPTFDTVDEVVGYFAETERKMVEGSVIRITVEVVPQSEYIPEAATPAAPADESQVPPFVVGQRVVSYCTDHDPMDEATALFPGTVTDILLNGVLVIEFDGYSESFEKDPKEILDLQKVIDAGRKINQGVGVLPARATGKPAGQTGGCGGSAAAAAAAAYNSEADFDYTAEDDYDYDYDYEDDPDKYRY